MDGVKCRDPKQQCKLCHGTGRLRYKITEHGERDEFVMDDCRYCEGTGFARAGYMVVDKVGYRITPAPKI